MIIENRQVLHESLAPAFNVFFVVYKFKFYYHHNPFELLRIKW